MCQRVCPPAGAATSRTHIPKHSNTQINRGQAQGIRGHKGADSDRKGGFREQIGLGRGLMGTDRAGKREVDAGVRQKERRPKTLTSTQHTNTQTHKHKHAQLETSSKPLNQNQQHMRTGG